MKLLMPIALATALLGGCGSMHSPMHASMHAPARTVDGMLVGPNQMTLYTFDRDVAGSGKSVCNGPCATNWPPFMVGASDKAAGDYSVVTRDDGAKQWAFKGKPLYYWARDTKPGDKSGDNFNNAWRIARP